VDKGETKPICGKIRESQIITINGPGFFFATPRQKKYFPKGRKK
jgi:hypothetical protein